MEKHLMGSFAVALSLFMISSLISCSSSKAEVPKDNNAAGAEETTDKEPLTVAFMYSSPANDGGFSQAHDEGRQYDEKMQGDKVKTIYQESVPENATDVEAAMRVMY